MANWEVRWRGKNRSGSFWSVRSVRSVRSCALEDEVKDKDEYEYDSRW